MYSLPITIKIRDNDFNIREKGDFRMVLDCFSALQDSELSEEERVISSLIIFYEDATCYEDLCVLFPNDDLQVAVEKMYDFFNCGQKTIGSKTDYKLVDWDTDSQIICSAINTVANKEIRIEPYVHWWTFMGYYISIGESLLSTVVSIRHKIASGKKLEKYEQDFKRENPTYFNFDYRTVEQREEDAKIREMWKGG